MENIIITGSSGGLGGYMCDEFLRRGCRVFAIDIHAEENLSDHEERREDRFDFIQADVGSDESVKSALGRIMEKADRIDMIVSCSGILPENSASILEDFDIDQSVEVYNVNALGPLRLVQAALPLLRKGSGKTIVNISSEAGSMTTMEPYTFRYDYCGSKAALNIQSIILQRYLKPEGFKVMLFHPGWMRTQMGGEDAPIHPRDAAAALYARIREQQDNDQYEICLMNYDGSIRSW